MKRIIGTMDCLKRTSMELVLGMIAGCLLCEGMGLIFIKDKFDYSIGILYGMSAAIVFMLHMACNLSKAMNWNAENARKMVVKGAAFRYWLLIILISIFGYFQWGNIIACLLGIMSLKGAAYLQPSVHKIINHMLKIDEKGGNNDDCSHGLRHRFYDPWSD